jgi:hypothetical protein
MQSIPSGVVSVGDLLATFLTVRPVNSSWSGEDAAKRSTIVSFGLTTDFGGSFEIGRNLRVLHWMSQKDENRLQLARVVKGVEYFRNLYSRIAQRFGVDRSLVCLVARGQRRSATIEKGLIAEFEQIKKQLFADSTPRANQDRAA